MELRRVAMTENEAIARIIDHFDVHHHDNRPHPLLDKAVEMAIKALEEIQKYREIGTVEECLKNKDFLDFLSDKMNPNDFETYLRLYNALEEKGCE